MTGNQTLKFLRAPFEKFVCIKGQNFVSISEKKKISNPYSKTRHPYRDREKGVKKGTVWRLLNILGKYGGGYHVLVKLPKLSHNLPIVCFVVSCFNLGTMKSYVWFCLLNELFLLFFFIFLLSLSHNVAWQTERYQNWTTGSSWCDRDIKQNDTDEE